MVFGCLDFTFFQNKKASLNKMIAEKIFDRMFMPVRRDKYFVKSIS
jgi:hypothetical protein